MNLNLIIYSIRKLKLNKKTAKKISWSIFLVIFIYQFVFHGSATQAFSEKIIQKLSPKQDINQVFSGRLPKSKPAPKWKIKIPLSAYNSHPSQTDSTPCITASGYDLCKANQENVIATNFLPFGTKVKIPELFGDKEFTVVDRMNPRYYYKADIWMRNYEDAIKFGNKYATVEIY